MRRLTLAFALGCAAFAIVVVIAAATVAIVADAAAWPAFRVAVGPLLLAEFERGPNVTSTTFGPGLALVPIVGGALNAGAAALVRLRTNRR